MSDFENDFDYEVGELPRDLTPEALAREEKKSYIKRKLSAAFNLCLLLGGAIGCLVYTGSISKAFLYYIFGYVVLSILVKLIPNIGFHKPGFYTVSDGHGDLKTVYDPDYVEFYGLGALTLDFFRDLFIFAAITSLIFLSLPFVIFTVAVIGTIVFVVLQCFVLPVIKDTVILFSKRDFSDFFDAVRSVVTYAVAALSVVALIVSCFVFANTLPGKLDTSAVISEYYGEKPNPFEKVEISEDILNFKWFGTECVIDYTGSFDDGSGIAKEGTAKVELKYDMEKWEVENITPYFEKMKFTKPIIFAGETENFETADFAGTSVFKLDFSSYESGVGEGKLTVIDKSTGLEIFSSEFTVEAVAEYSTRNTASKKHNLVLETGIPGVHFGYGTLHLIFDYDENTFEIEEYEAKVAVE